MIPFFNLQCHHLEFLPLHNLGGGSSALGTAKQLHRADWTLHLAASTKDEDRQILDDSAQISASLRLTRWLRCTYGIELNNVIGHNESLSSPYHRERVPAFQHQTHSDFNHADMHIYRTRLARLKCPDGSFAKSPRTGGT